MTQPLTDANFSIIRGGLLERFLILIRVASPDNAHTLRKIFFFTAITWIPLLVLSTVEGLLWGDKVQVSFLPEFATHIRLLIAIPLFLVAEVVVDNRVKITLKQFTRTGLVTEGGMAQFELAKQKADRMCESIWAEVFILALIVFNLVFRSVVNPISLTTWAFPDNIGHGLSLAGYWAAIVSLPLFQFLALRWLWRWIIWVRLMLMISKAGLRLHPAHPDKSGGLGFLGEPPFVFSLITFTLGVVFAAMLAEFVVFMDLKLRDHYALIGAFALLSVLINVAPLLTFIIPISLARTKGIFDYNALIIDHYRGFDDKWIERQSENETLLGSPDVSSVSDFGPIYESINKMTPFPFDFRIMLLSIIISLLPLLPVFALQIPIAEMFKMLTRILL